MKFLVFTPPSIYQKVYVPLTCWLCGPSVPLPPPWHNRPSSLEYEVFQIFWYLVCLRSCQYLRYCPVSSSITGISQSRIKSHGYLRPEECDRETRLSVCDRLHHSMGSAGIGNGGDLWYRVRRSTDSGTSACWG